MHFYFVFDVLPTSYDLNDNKCLYILISRNIDNVKHKDNKKLVEINHIDSYFLYDPNNKINSPIGFSQHAVYKFINKNKEFKNTIKEFIYTFHKFINVSIKWNHYIENKKDYINLDSTDINNIIVLEFNEKDNFDLNPIKYDFYHIQIDIILRDEYLLEENINLELNIDLEIQNIQNIETINALTLDHDLFPKNFVPDLLHTKSDTFFHSILFHLGDSLFSLYFYRTFFECRVAYHPMIVILCFPINC